jgi:8-oxo-dGTP pyrophosphatase MutT (NUDIX family)
MSREELRQLVDAIAPHDEHEAADKQDALTWITSDAPLYRIQKPDIPPKHLVSYFAIIDPKSKKILLQDHLLAKLWLPAGGHVEPDEDPAEAALRECKEELGFAAGFLGVRKPHFITITTTNGQGEHTDVSLWYVLEASESTPLVIEPGKFADVKWWGIEEVLESPITLFDPELHRFIRKLQSISLV